MSRNENIEEEMEDIRMAAVGLTNHIKEFQRDHNIDMGEEIIAYFHEKLEVSE